MSLLRKPRAMLSPSKTAEKKRTSSRTQCVMAGQGRIPRMQRALTARKELQRHRLGIVPPQLARHAPKERERLDETVQDRLGPLGGHRQREGSVRVRPRRQQHRNLAPTIREIDVDMPEVRLRPMPRRMIERNERLATIERPFLQISADLIVTTDIAVFGSQPTKNLRRRVPLLTRRLLVGRHNGIDDRAKRPLTSSMRE
jgi:hypothetical protein